MTNVKMNPDAQLPPLPSQRLNPQAKPANTQAASQPGLSSDALQISATKSSTHPAQLSFIQESSQTTPIQRFQGSKEEYFNFLDHDPELRKKAKTDAVGALLDLMARKDLPADLEKAYTRQAGSTGGGRILLVLDYTRGTPSSETSWQALKQGPMHYLSSKIITPMLTHFREVDGGSLFPGDATMTPAFRDSTLWGPKTNQVGHMLCALETGVRMGKLSKSSIESKSFDLAIKAATKIAGFEHIQGNALDFSRAGVIGHEMKGDGDGGGFLSQMKAYDQLVANGDPDKIRTHWDLAVAAVHKNDHAAAYQHIYAISKAIEAPTTPEEVAQNLANKHPRFAPPHQPREGNSSQDIALSVYGFALGYQAMTQGLNSPASARSLFESILRENGSQAQAINQAAGIQARK